MSSVVLPTGMTILYQQDTNGDLTQISVSPAAGLPAPSATTSRSYTYSSATGVDELDHNLLTVRDSGQQLLVTVTYGSGDRVASQTQAGGQYTFTPLTGPARVRVVSPTGEAADALACQVERTSYPGLRWFSRLSRDVQVKRLHHAGHTANVRAALSLRRTVLARVCPTGLRPRPG
jgi:hypothetical protein